MDEKRRWVLQPQEQEGTYTFSGKSYMTSGINAKLTPYEVLQIHLAVQERVMEKGGADYLQVFKNGSGRKIFVIDNLNQEMKKNNDEKFVEEHDYFTIMFSEEY